MDWNLDTIDEIRRIHTFEVVNFTRHEIAKKSPLREIIAYGKKANYIWAPYWNEFMYGEKNPYEKWGNR